MIQDISVVSLSRGILGEPFIKHELDIGVKRLEALGLNVRFSEHALAGLDFIAAHPEKRAEDLLAALKSDTDMILCAFGGDDGYRLLPYLFENDELKKAADLINVPISVESTVGKGTVFRLDIKNCTEESYAATEISAD